MSRLILFLAVLLLTSTAVAQRDPDLLALLDEHVDWLMRENPVWASQRGDLRFNDRLEDLSPEAHARRLGEMRVRLAQVDEWIARDRVYADIDELDAGLLRHELASSIEAARFFPEQTPIDARSGPQVWLPQLHDRLPFTERKHYADYAARLEQIPAQIDQHIAQMRLGLAAGRVPPRIVMHGVVEQARAQVHNDPTRSPFFTPLHALPDGDPLRERAARAVEAIGPAFTRLADFLEQDYLPNCRDSIAASDGPDGRAYYDFTLRYHTTTHLSAEEIHEIGLREIERIRDEMLEVIARTDFKGRDIADPGQRLADFLLYLRTSPRFYANTPQQLLADYRDICKQMDAELPRLFRTLPRLPCGVREMAAYQAPASPNGYYYGGSLKTGVAAYFVVNTYALDQRPTYEMRALAFHEANPGHHLQLALADELADSPDQHEFRSLLSYTAFVEGWALYAERLGLEVGAAATPFTGSGAPAMPPGVRADESRGFYANPYDDFGRLTYDAWRACRLVVDTGIHALGWSREEAIDYMLANTALSRTNIEREVDRYIAWPGQACGYKIGQLRILAIRDRAEAALGEDFDLRAFHDALLGSGALPLDVLDQHMNRWIASQQR